VRETGLAVLDQLTPGQLAQADVSPSAPKNRRNGIDAEKNALTFEVLSDVGQIVGRAFNLVYEFTDELKQAYRGFNLDIPARNGTPGDWRCRYQRPTS
jgi:hypothetical protein